MSDWFHKLLRCPDCGSALSIEPSSWKCTNCAFNTSAQKRDLRPTTPKIASLEMPVAHDPRPDEKLRTIDTCAPAITYLGPQAVRDSRAFMSVIEDLMAPGSKILDLGCGSCDQQAPIEHLGHLYAGVDYSSDQAHCLADAHSLPFESASFDCVFSYAALEHFYNPLVALKEIERVLDDGGLYLGTVSQGEPFHQSYFHHTAWGFLSLLETVPGLEVMRIWPALDTLESLSRMGRYPRLVKYLLRLLDRMHNAMPFLAPRKMRWPDKDKQIDALYRCGSIAFVVRKQGR